MRGTALLALIFAATPAVAQDATGTAANNFYAVYGSLRAQRGGLPDATGRTRYATVLTPRLNQQLTDAAGAQARFARKVKGAAPPLVEGDIFTSQFDGATSWSVGACTGDGRTARCPVALVYRPAARPNGTVEKPVNWTDILVLASTPSGWKVDDVIYDTGLAQGNTGKLSETLAMAVAEAAD